MMPTKAHRLHHKVTAACKKRQNTDYIPVNMLVVFGGAKENLNVEKIHVYRLH